MGALFDHYDVEPVMGKDITIGDCFPEVFISDTDTIFCYIGICLSDIDRRNQASFIQPYYMRGMHSTDKKTSKETTGFYRMIDGCIFLDNYIDADLYSEHLYKKIDCGIRFPAPDNYYAVFVNKEEDPDLTRGIFGLTHEEITSLLEAYAKAMGIYHEYTTYPRLTKSPRSVNYCDITDLWIPERFPYVAFNDSGYHFSHVSLWGFYRHIQLLTGYKINSVFSKALLKFGVNEEILNRVFNIGTRIFYQTKVTNGTFDY